MKYFYLILLCLVMGCSYSKTSCTMIDAEIARKLPIAKETHDPFVMGEIRGLAWAAIEIGCKCED